MAGAQATQCPNCGATAAPNLPCPDCHVMVPATAPPANGGSALPTPTPEAIREAAEAWDAATMPGATVDMVEVNGRFLPRDLGEARRRRPIPSPRNGGSGQGKNNRF